MNPHRTPDSRRSPRLRSLALIVALTLGAAACSTADDALSVPEALPLLEETTTTTENDDTTTSEAEPTTSAPADEGEPEPAATEPPTSEPAESDPATTDPVQGESPTTTPPTTAAPATDAPAATDAPSGDELAEAEAESFRLLNELRASLGLSALTRNSTMDSFARDWSTTMATSGSFKHSDGPYAENIAWNSQTSLTPKQAAKALHDSWVDSPGHYANMTNAQYVTAGMGFYRDAGGWHATHVFDR